MPRKKKKPSIKDRKASTSRAPAKEDPEVAAERMRERKKNAPPSDVSPRMKEAIPSYFKTIIRTINTHHVGTAKQIRAASWTALKRLGYRSKIEQAVDGIPEGSDQINIGSLVTWMNKILPQDKVAIRQLLRIDATAAKRIKG
jgi:hypothetical protein